MTVDNSTLAKSSLDLSLRTSTEEDVKQLWEIVSTYKKELRPWLDWVDMIHSIEDYMGYMNRVKYEEDIGIQKAFVLCIDDLAQGEIVFDDFDARTRSCNMGYWISPQWQQKGVMFSACKIAISRAFESLNIDKINIRFISTNVASHALALKLGFSVDGVLRKNILYQGRIEDEVIMSCFRQEWKF